VRAERAGRGCWGCEREVHEGHSWGSPLSCVQLAGVELSDCNCSSVVHPANTDNPIPEAEPGGKRVPLQREEWCQSPSSSGLKDGFASAVPFRDQAKVVGAMSSCGWSRGQDAHCPGGPVAPYTGMEQPVAEDSVCSRCMHPEAGAPTEPCWSGDLISPSGCTSYRAETQASRR